MLSFKIGKKKDGAVPEDKELIKDLEAFKKLLKNGIERLEKGQLAEHQPKEADDLIAKIKAKPIYKDTKEAEILEKVKGYTAKFNELQAKANEKKN